MKKGRQSKQVSQRKLENKIMEDEICQEKK